MPAEVIPSIVNALDDILKSGLAINSWNFPPNAVNTNSPLTSQTIYVVAVPYRAGQIVTNIAYSVSTAAAGTAPAGAFVGLADSSRTMQAQSGNLSGGFLAAGIQNFALAAAYTIPASGIYYHVLLQNGSWGTTQPAFHRGTSLAGVTSPGGVFLYGTAGTGQTALPANGSALGAFSSTGAFAFFTAST